MEAGRKKASINTVIISGLMSCVLSMSAVLSYGGRRICLQNNGIIDCHLIASAKCK